MPYPVLTIIGRLKEALEIAPVVILQAPPGAGKSTVVPISVIDDAWLSGKKIIMLEPRRLATRAVATRMSSMLQEEAGQSVGYRVRFETRVGPKTRIEVVTEGILTRMLQNDNALSDVGLVIFDEFHERSLHADLALALCLQIQQILRPDLKILIMSATLDAANLASKFGNAPVVTSEGKQFPVTTFYFPSEANVPLPQHTVRAVRKAFHSHAGDILVFLPGAGEIRRVAGLLDTDLPEASVVPLYGDLPYKKQQEAILPDPAGRRKIILATSIAETSLTIEGVGIVIDAGFSRVPKFDPRSGFTRLETVRVSKDSADQRTGRAGRVGPGVCYRLWSEAVQSNLPSQRVPEISEADLAPLMLELLAWGVSDINDLTWVTTPPPGAVAQALTLLYDLRAVRDGKITSVGRAMLRLPTHPRIAHMLMEASATDPVKAVSLAADIASLLEERDVLSQGAGADIGLRLETLRSWRKGARVNADTNALDRVQKLADSWKKILQFNQHDDGAVDEFLAGRLLMAAYPERVSRRVDQQNARYKLANGRSARLAANDPLVREQWLAIADLDGGTGDGRIFLAAPLLPDDLAPYVTDREVVRWDDERGMLVANTEQSYGSLVVSAKPLPTIPDESKVMVLCQVVKDRGLEFIGWSEQQRAIQNRILSLKLWRPDEAWPDVSDAALLDRVDGWLAPFLTDVKKEPDFRKIPLDSALLSVLPWELQSRLVELAPEKLVVPSGSLIPIQYSAHGDAPVVEVRLQEVFGLGETPAVNEGRTRILLHLLSPGYKPVQVTQDLHSFWNNTYQEIRKTLKIRYPKHSWPEDPWTAEAVRGVKRKH